MSRQEMGMIDQVLMATALVPGLRFQARAQQGSSSHLHSCHTLGCLQGQLPALLCTGDPNDCCPCSSHPGKAGAGAANTGTAWVEGEGVGLSPSLGNFSFSIQVS